MKFLWDKVFKEMKITYRQYHHKNKKGAKMTTETKKRYLEGIAIRMKKQNKEW